MATLESAESTAKGLRQIIQDLVAPELRELKAEARATNKRLDGMDSRLDRLEQAMTNGFENIRRQLDVYKDVQVLKERMVRVEVEHESKPTEPK